MFRCVVLYYVRFDVHVLVTKIFNIYEMKMLHEMKWLQEMKMLHEMKWLQNI